MGYPFERVIKQSEATIVIVKIPRLVGVVTGRHIHMFYMTNGGSYTVGMLSREVRRTLRTRDGGGGTCMASVLTIVGADHLC